MSATPPPPWEPTPPPWQPTPPSGPTQIRSGGQGTPTPSYPAYPTQPQGPWTPTGPGGGPPPPKRNTGLVVTLCVAVALAIVAVTVLGVVIWRQSDDGDDQGRDTAGDTGGETEPSDPAPSAPESPAAPSSPAAPAPSSPSEPAPSQSPSEEPPAAPDPTPTEPDPSPGEDGDLGAFSYTEYGDDWDFRYDDVALKAKFQRGWDYDDCGPAENDGAMTALGCVRASEWTYRALKGDLALTQVVYTMKSEKAAKKVIDRELIDEDAWHVQRASTLPGRAGSWRANYTGVFIVLTVETHEPDVRQNKAQEFVGYGNADIVGALGFRF